MSRRREFHLFDMIELLFLENDESKLLILTMILLSFHLQGCGKDFCRKTTLTKHTRRQHPSIADNGDLPTVVISNNGAGTSNGNGVSAAAARGLEDLEGEEDDDEDQKPFQSSWSLSQPWSGNGNGSSERTYFTSNDHSKSYYGPSKDSRRSSGSSHYQESEPISPEISKSTFYPPVFGSSESHSLHSNGIGGVHGQLSFGRGLEYGHGKYERGGEDHQHQLKVQHQPISLPKFPGFSSSISHSQVEGFGSQDGGYGPGGFQMPFGFGMQPQVHSTPSSWSSSNSSTADVSPYGFNHHEPQVQAPHHAIHRVGEVFLSSPSSSQASGHPSTPDTSRGTHHHTPQPQILRAPLPSYGGVLDHGASSYIL